MWMLQAKSCHSLSAPLLIFWAEARQGEALANKIYNFTPKFQVFFSKWSASKSLNSFMETPQRSSAWVSKVQWKHNTEIICEKAFSDKEQGEFTGFFLNAKVKGQYVEDRVLVVLQFSGGVWKDTLSATWVAQLFQASLLTYCHWLYALVSLFAHCLGDKCWFCFMQGKLRQQNLDFCNSFH